MLYFLYQIIRVYYQNNDENLRYFFLTPISSIRNFLPFCLPQFDESNIYIPPSSIFSLYTSRTFPLLLFLIFFVPFHTQFSTPLPFLLFTLPLVLAASNRSGSFYHRFAGDFLPFVDGGRRLFLSRGCFKRTR